MSRLSENVKRWRSKTKQRMIDAFGGKCGICGYNRCNDSLEFHHLNPDEKDFTFAQIRSNIRGWDKIIIELRKCVLLCSNCHKEIHSTECKTIIPDDIQRFDERYADYRLLEHDVNECPTCGGEKPKHLKSCSRSCAARLKNKIDWSIIDLKSLLEEYKTYTKVSDVLEISPAAVRKRAIKLGLDLY